MTDSPAERYLVLGLELGRHVAGIVDAYFGLVRARYLAGREDRRAWVGGDPARFRRFLTEQVRVGEPHAGERDGKIKGGTFGLGV